MTARLQYLESLDSIRAPWTAREDREFSDLQILLEVVLSLALGRDVVVPQPYALDSLGFLRAADIVLEARDVAARRNEDGPKDAPFRLHLYGANTFEEAATKMLARVSDPGRPFYSSLMPELNDPGRDLEDLKGPTSSLDALLSSGLIDDERARLIDRVRGEFRASPRAPQSSGGTTLGLNEMISQFTQSSSTSARTTSESTQLVRDVSEHLRVAFRRLDPTRQGAFEQRSRVHLDMPWLGDLDGRTPAEVVGSASRLQLVQEFVDTLYNRIVAASIQGAIRAMFTTPPASGSTNLVARAIAQDLALSVYDGAPAPGPRPSSRTPDFEPAFQAFADDASTGDISAAVAKIRTDIIVGLPGLMQARADRGDGRRQRSEFWKGIDRFHDKFAADDTATARTELDKHFRVVNRLMSGAVTTSTRVKGMELATAGIGGAGTTVAAGIAMPGSLLASGIAAGIGAVISAGVVPAASRIERRGRRIRLAHALGRVIDLRSVGT